jgi:deazaflavin-dependent oxidoreductase (nitroreductase family)
MSILFKLVTATHVGLYRATGGLIGSSLAGQRMVLLTTIGNKTGKPRTSPVVVFEEGGKRYVVASKGGAPSDPFWFKNMQKTPELTVQLGKEIYRARARVLDDPERERLFRMVVEKMPQFGGYEKKTEGKRKIPVVELVALSS